MADGRIEADANAEADEDRSADGTPGDTARPNRRAPWPRRTWTTMRSWDGRTVRLVIVCSYVGLTVANFIWMWPILMGDPITPQRLMWETWLPSWG